MNNKIKFSISQRLIQTALFFCLLSGVTHVAGASVNAAEHYPVARQLTRKVQLRNAALAVMEGYNAHVRDAAAKRQTPTDKIISDAFASVTSAGIMDVRYRYPMSAREKSMSDALRTLSFHLTQKQTQFTKIYREDAFCALKHTLFLYPAVKFQKAELDSVRQNKVLYRVLHMCPGEIGKKR